MGREKALPTTTQLASGRARTLIQDLDTCLTLSSLQSRTLHRILPSTTILLDQGPAKRPGAREKLWDRDTLIFKGKNRGKFSLQWAAGHFLGRTNGKGARKGRGRASDWESGGLS